jgi:hypothetical protein
VTQDCQLQALQGGARLDAEFLDERPAGLCIHLERVRLTIGAVEREHLLRA